MKIDDARDALYFSDNMNERSEIEGLGSLLRGARTFVDVGASFGQYTFNANRIIRHGRLIAVEADPLWFSRLDANVREWSTTSTNRIEAVHAAISDRTEPISFFTNGEISGAAFVSKGPEFDNPKLEWREVTVNAVTLDDLLRDADPDFIKIDIEGFEYRALAGATRILAEKHCRFLIEVHPWGDPTNGKKPEDVFTLMFLAKYDFQRYHRHWLFSYSKSRIKSVMKYHAIMFVWRNPKLQRVLKQLALAWDSPRR